MADTPPVRPNSFKYESAAQPVVKTSPFGNPVHDTGAVAPKSPGPDVPEIVPGKAFLPTPCCPVRCLDLSHLIGQRASCH
jgi:hypothetical protein